MGPSDVQRIRSATVRGKGTTSQLDAWVAAEGGTSGLLVSMTVRRPVTKELHGHTLQTWVNHQLRALKGALSRGGAENVSPRLRKDPAAESSLLTHYTLPLPNGAMQVRARHWLSSDGHGVEATCLCAGSGCTQPPSCSLASAPADALPGGTILGTDIPPITLETASADGRVQAPPHLSPLPAAMLAQLERVDEQRATRRSSKRIQGLKAPDGSGVFLSEATWCAQPPACEAESLAENRRKAEVDSLRAGGTLRSVETHASPHAEVPMYGFEIAQHDGFWTRTTFWNESGAVREVSCACAGLACASVQRTCEVRPSQAP